MNQEKYSAFKFQISGHSILLKLESSGQLIKSCSNKNNNEQQFYEFIQSCPDYTNYFPQYYGEIELNQEELQIITDGLNEWQSKLYNTRFTKQQKKFLLLQDFSYLIENPNILDIKLGFNAHKTNNINKYAQSTSVSLGFRINGIYKQNKYFKDKYYCRSIQKNDVIAELQSFFNINTNPKSKEVINQLINQIENMKIYLQKQCQAVICWDSVSLLIVFNENQNTANIHLIDFQNTLIDKQNKNMSHLNSILNAINSFQSFLQYL